MSGNSWSVSKIGKFNSAKKKILRHNAAAAE